MLISLGRQLHKRTFDCIQTNSFHFGQYLFLEIVIFLGIRCIQIFLKLSIANFVCRFIPPVERSVLLNCIISEMDFSFEVEYIELVRSGPNVSFLIPICFEDSVQLTYHHVMSNIEFPSFVEKRSIYVQLHYESFFSPVIMLALAFHYRVQLIHLIDNSYAVSSISQLSWLDYPDVAHWTTDRKAIFFVSFLLANYRLAFFMIPYESFVLWVFCSFFDVEGEWNDLEKLTIGELIVLFEVIEKSLFVAEIEVVGEMVMHFLILVFMFRQLQNLLPFP